MTRNDSCIAVIAFAATVGLEYYLFAQQHPLGFRQAYVSLVFGTILYIRYGKKAVVTTEPGVDNDTDASAQYVANQADPSTYNPRDFTEKELAKLAASPEYQKWFELKVATERERTVRYQLYRSFVRGFTTIAVFLMFACDVSQRGSRVKGLELFLYVTFTALGALDIPESIPLSVLVSSALCAAVSESIAFWSVGAVTLRILSEMLF
eukprot:PhF_6_TR13405/c0_g1_i1/m.21329